MPYAAIYYIVYSLLCILQTKLPFCKVNLPIVNRTKVLFTIDGFAYIFFAYRCEAANARWNTANRWLSISKREFL